MFNDEKFQIDFFERFQKVEHLIFSIIYPEHKNMFAKFNLKFEELAKVDERFTSIQSFLENLHLKVDNHKKDSISSFHNLDKKFESYSNESSKHHRENNDRFLSLENIVKSFKDSLEDPKRKIEFLTQKLDSLNESIDSIKFLKSSMEEMKKNLENKINSSSQTILIHAESLQKIEKSKSALQLNIEEQKSSIHNIRKEFSEMIDKLSHNGFIQKNEIIDLISEKLQKLEKSVDEKISHIHFPEPKEETLSKEVMNQIHLYSKDVSKCMVKSENLHTQYKILDKKLEKLIQDIKK